MDRKSKLTPFEYERRFKQWSGGISIFQARQSKDWVKAIATSAGELADLQNDEIADLLDISQRSLHLYKRKFLNMHLIEPHDCWIDLAKRMMKEI